MGALSTSGVSMPISLRMTARLSGATPAWSALAASLATIRSPVAGPATASATVSPCSAAASCRAETHSGRSGQGGMMIQRGECTAFISGGAQPGVDFDGFLDVVENLGLAALDDQGPIAIAGDQIGVVRRHQ